MITKREKLQYVYVFLTDIAALAASVILAWLIEMCIRDRLAPCSCQSQAVLRFRCLLCTFFIACIKTI